MKDGQYLLTPLEAILINKKMPYGIKLDTEENVLQSLEISRQNIKKVHSIYNKHNINLHYYSQKDQNQSAMKHQTFFQMKTHMTNLTKQEKEKQILIIYR